MSYDQLKACDETFKNNKMFLYTCEPRTILRLTYHLIGVQKFQVLSALQSQVIFLPC